MQAILEPYEVDDVIIHFVDLARICQLHGEYFDDPSPTDCITFPIDSPGPDCQVLGEVFVCPHTAITYAKEHSLDPYSECTLYIVHGLLHLLGFDDIDEADQLKMRAMEKQSMTYLEQLHLILTPPEC